MEQAIISGLELQGCHTSHFAILPFLLYMQLGLCINLTLLDYCLHLDLCINNTFGLVACQINWTLSVDACA